MKRTITLLFLLALCSTTAIQAQAPAPKPDPELKKLSVFVGHWTWEGEHKTGPGGPGGKLTGEWTGQMILGGFFFQGQTTEKWPQGEVGSLLIFGYDSVNKRFIGNWYLSDGSRLSGLLTVAGNAYTYAGKFLTPGKQYQYRWTFVVAPDLASGTLKEESSVDGKTWTPVRDSQWTKVKSAAKK